MKIEINAAGLWKSIRVLAFSSALVFSLQACKRPHTTGLEDEVEPLAEVPREPDEAEESFLDPLTGAAWLGHADDGALVKVEFFVNVDTASTLCRTTVENSFGASASSKSSFAASSELSNITWDDDKSRGSYDAETRVVEATLTARTGKHHAKLRQVTTASNPELTTFRKSIPDDADSQDAHQKFSERLTNGARWWKSITEWEKLVTPKELAASGEYLALIRPAGNEPIKIPALKPGEGFDIPLICHLPPKVTLTSADQTVGVVAELQHEDNVRSMWLLGSLNPGALTQEIKAYWAGDKTEPVLSGAATLYIYLCKTAAAEGSPPASTATTNRPVSNLLKIDLEFTGGDGGEG